MTSRMRAISASRFWSQTSRMTLLPDAMPQTGASHASPGLLLPAGRRARAVPIFGAFVRAQQYRGGRRSL
jgi:hypothetical protein